MSARIELNCQENVLRRFLLDVSHFIGDLKGISAPGLRFTGGWVRDKLLGHPSKDIDIGIDGMTGSDFAHFLKQYLGQEEAHSKYPLLKLGGLATIAANPEKSKHLETVRTRILGFDVDMVNLRKETYSNDSRNPVMSFGSPEEDALRRDATINALFYNLETGNVEDFTDRGLQDLRLKKIKTPLAPLQTFRDDPLRILRSIRFASKLGFELDGDDKAAMMDHSIKNALRIKISRERIGIEVTKMLKSSNPHKALALLDEIGLYGAIFTVDHTCEHSNAVMKSWHKAYNTLLKITQADCQGKEERTYAERVIKGLLIRNIDDEFLAWIITCFVPWARKQDSSSPSGPQRAMSPAGRAAKEGIKADNRVVTVVNEASYYLQEILDLVGQGHPDSPQPNSKRKIDPMGRDILGLFIRKLGHHWRCIVLFSLLTKASEQGDDEQTNATMDQFAIWLSRLADLNLLDADQIKPIVNGNQLMAALNLRNGGPWMKRAMEEALAWQLRHPGSADSSAAVHAIVERRRELGIPCSLCSQLN